MSRPVLPVTEVLISTEHWRCQADCEALVQCAINAAAAMATSASIGGAEVAVLLTDDAGIRALNHDWRGIDKPTNVLSFPASPAGNISGVPRLLGDIAIAYETTRREAEAEQKPFANHLSHLTVHGFLHLIGFDHQTDDDAQAMEDLERRILAGLGIPDPYADAAYAHDPHARPGEGN